jgi:Methyltransferase domain
MTMWDERFDGEDYVFGTEPNAWLADQASRIKPAGRVLSLAEGEGRNAVWLAGQGLRVEGVDGSAVGLSKARLLAATRGVDVRWTMADLADCTPDGGAYDGVVLIFIHLPPGLRERVHARAEEALVAGGALIVEAFTPGQLAYESGGPRDLERLYTVDLLRADFPAIRWDVLEERVIELDEGPGHRGKGAVVRGVGRKT